MAFRTIPGLDREYALISFDEQGVERREGGGLLSQTLVDKARTDKPTHLFLFSHGWKGDEPAAIDQYDRWIGAMWALEPDRRAFGEGFRPLFVGLHWPSQPWGDEAIPSAGTSFGADGAGTDALLEAAVVHFGGEHVRPPLTVIFRAFAENPATKILPDDVVQAYRDLGRAIGFAAGAGADAPPDQEGAALDPQAAVRAEKVASAGESFGIFGAIRNGVLAGLRQASFWMMKHRARTVGEQGMHQFVSDLQRACEANVHLMGHSFGCIVVSGILAGPNGSNPLPRPVNSAALVQGAMSLWSFAEKIPDADTPGYFRGILSAGAVSGPIVATQSANDSAVGLAFPAAVGLVNEFDFAAPGAAAVVLPKFGGIGTWGIQGTTIAERRAMLAKDGEYRFKPGGVYNLDGSAFIPSHSGIDGPEVAHLLWQAVSASKGQQV